MVSDIKRPFAFISRNWLFFGPVMTGLLALAVWGLNKAWAEYTSAAGTAAHEMIAPVKADIQEVKAAQQELKTGQKVMEAKIDVMLIDRGHDPRAIAASPNP